jgi:hypothetical protein
VVAGSGLIVTIRLKVIEKSQDQIEREVIDFERVDFYVKIVCSKGKKKGKGIPIGFDGMLTAAFYVGQVLIEEFNDAGG